MRTPKTVKGYLKLLIQIASESSYDLKDITDDEAYRINCVRASIQNEIGVDEDGFGLAPLLKKYKLKDHCGYNY